MEDYEYKVINLHATLSQNSSKFTGNTSKNTSKSTSKTNQIRLGGPWGGLTPLLEPLEAVSSPPQIRGAMGVPSNPIAALLQHHQATLGWLRDLVNIRLL